MPNLYLEVRDEDDDAGQTPAPLPEDEALALLTKADFSGTKLIPWGSNYSFAVALGDEAQSQLAIYKPRAGEAPLYDFPDGTLYRREVAAYRLSRAAGWDLVPPTVARDGPHGVGSLQLYVEPEPEGRDPHRFWGQHRLDIERMVLFDHVTNNADRKIGHCLRDGSGRVWGIDHGLTFNTQPKLRTVLWQYVGEPISAPLVEDLARLRACEPEVRADLAPWLDGDEIDALFRRIDELAELGSYPALNPRRNVPYGWW